MLLTGSGVQPYSLSVLEEMLLVDGPSCPVEVMIGDQMLAAVGAAERAREDWRMAQYWGYYHGEL